MIYLLLGDDSTGKADKIDEIKGECLPSADALKFDWDSLDGRKLHPHDLKIALTSLPAVARKRLVIIKTADKLNAHNKELVSEFIEMKHRSAVLILDCDTMSPRGNFFRDVKPQAKVFRFGSKARKRDIWDMTKAVERRNAGAAVNILNGLFEDGESPLRVLGGLVWFWGSLRGRLSARGFKKGLLVLQEADLNIKRSRLRPETAVEVAVTKLSLLVAC